MAAVQAERGLPQVTVPPLCLLDFDGDLSAPTTDILDPLVKELSAVSTTVGRGRVWSTDAPYRETAEQLRFLG